MAALHRGAARGAWALTAQPHRTLLSHLHSTLLSICTTLNLPTENMLPFKHRNLNLQEKEIRLLRLDKTDDEATPIRLSIRHATLDDKLEFNALSYAWGDDPPAHNVIICDENGEEGLFAIRENLHDFFVAARKFHEPWTTEWIWIDQICINQNYHEERCHQVAQMAMLYSTAKATIVWPGLMPATPEETPEFSSLIDHPRYEHFMHEHFRHDIWNEIFDKDLMEKIMRCCLSSLLAQPYWFRLWIVQEIALASSVVVFLTHTTCSLDLLEGTLHVAWNLLEDGTINQLNLKLLMHKVIDLRYIRDCTLRSSAISWYEVMWFSCETNFSESLDRVYALMGLVHESRRFQPDYNLSGRDLLKKVLQADIDFEKPKDRSIFAREVTRVVQMMRENLLSGDQFERANLELDWRLDTESKRIAADILTELGLDIGDEMKKLM